MSCAECHSPAVGFTGPNPEINKYGAVYSGAVDVTPFYKPYLS